jgi:nucleoside-diphosphate-sugar epimerase
MTPGGQQEPGRTDKGRLVALTGATGFLGSHIADTLLARGYRVRASIRATSSLRWLEGKNVETVQVDLTDPAACAGFLEGTTGLIHNAGVTTARDEAGYHRGNTDTTKALVTAAGRVWTSGDEAFVLVSSLAAHGPAGLDSPAVETNFCRPLTGYGRSKLAAELLLSEPGLGFRTAILRPPSLYGPRDREFLPLLKGALRGWTLKPGAMQGLSLVDGRDAARAAVTLLEHERSTGAYFVDDGHTGYSFSEMAALLGEVTGKKVRLLPVPIALMKLAAVLLGGTTATSPILNADRVRDLDTEGWVCDGERLVAETGFHPSRRAAEGLKETLAFYRSEEWL